MVERRKSKRIEMQSTIKMKRLDGGEVEEVAIEIMDVSQTGIGFFCDEPLMLGAFYESELTIWTKETLHVLLEIVRAEKLEDCFCYGATFIGMSEVDAYRIEVYQMMQDGAEELEEQ